MTAWPKDMAPLAKARRAGEAEVARVAKSIDLRPLPPTTAAMLENAAVAMWALYMVEHNAHWNSLGINTYQQHLLYERLYESAYHDADTLMERFIGLTGGSPAVMAKHALMLAAILVAHSQIPDLHDRVLAMERHVEDHLSQTRQQAQVEGVLSDGLDDLLMALADNRQASIALLGP